MTAFHQAFIFLLMLSGTLAVAQEKVYTSTSKKAVKAYETGMQHYDRMQLDEALAAFEDALRADSLFVEAYIMLAETWSDKRNPHKTVEYYNHAFRVNPSFFPANYLYAGVLEHTLGHYDDSKRHLEQFLASPATEDPKKKDLAEFTLNSVKFAIHAIANPVPFEPRNLGAAVNSSFNEYFPAITADNSTLLFTRQINDDRVRGGVQEDFYIAERDESGPWGPSKNMGVPINTPANEGAPTLSADGQIIIFTACEIAPGIYGPDRLGLGSCDLFYTRRGGSKWSKPVNLGPPINTNGWETQPSYSADGRSLYFIRGNSRGVKNGDIWYAYITDEGKWSEPVKLSDRINTSQEEQSVFIHPDGQTLYFSSKGHVGMGGFDIYMSKRQPDGEWGVPVNLGYPINTHGDENSLMVSADGLTGYFASDREGGKGGLDLYSFEMPEALRPEPVAYLKGKIFDKETTKPLDARFELIDLATEKVVVQSYSDPVSGEFLVVLPIGKEYALNVSKEQYLFYSEHFEMGAGTEARPFRRDVPLSRIREGESVVLRNVFFNTGSAELRQASRTELNRLADFMRDNPDVLIELSGHTDNVGDDASNQLLSENRAKAVYDFLVKAGIPADRMTYKGYGESNPVADNETEAGRQLNRRTEFKVTGRK